jgi:hypothetical protein
MAEVKLSPNVIVDWLEKHRATVIWKGQHLQTCTVEGWDMERHDLLPKGSGPTLGAAIENSEAKRAH